MPFANISANDGLLEELLPQTDFGAPAFAADWAGGFVGSSLLIRVPPPRSPDGTAFAAAVAAGALLDWAAAMSAFLVDGLVAFGVLACAVTSAFVAAAGSPPEEEARPETIAAADVPGALLPQAGFVGFGLAGAASTFLATSCAGGADLT